MRPAGIALYVIANLLVLRGLPLWVSADPAVRIALALLITFAATLAHELGHALAARWAGAEIHAIMVVPLRLRLRPRKLGWAGPAGRGDVGGYVSYTLDRIGSRRKQAWIAVAGPVANLVLAALAVLLTSPLSALGSYGGVAWLGTLAGFSVLMAIYNLIPFPGSDGQRILQNLRKPRRA